MKSSIDIFLEVCRQHGIGIDAIGDFHSAFRFSVNGHYYFMVDKCMGLNDEAMARLCKDKAYHYTLISPHVPMPLTIEYIDPDPKGPYARFATFPDLESIVFDLTSKFTYPLIIKRNSGSTGEHVYRASTENEALESFSRIFSKTQLTYDHVALAQADIAPVAEYRVIIFRGKVSLMYLKDISNARFTGNLSPLHWDNASAKIVNDTHLISECQSIADTIMKVFPLTFAGLDIAKDKDGKLWLIEVNNAPGFMEYLKYSNPAPLEKLYHQIAEYMAYTASTPRNS